MLLSRWFCLDLITLLWDSWFFSTFKINSWLEQNMFLGKSLFHSLLLLCMMSKYFLLLYIWVIWRRLFLVRSHHIFVGDHCVHISRAWLWGRLEKSACLAGAIFTSTIAHSLFGDSGQFSPGNWVILRCLRIYLSLVYWYFWSESITLWSLGQTSTFLSQLKLGMVI